MTTPAEGAVYLLGTDKAWAGTCRQLAVQLSGGSQHFALFQFTK